MTRKKGNPHFYGEPAIGQDTRNNQQKAPKLCGYLCGTLIYKDELTGYWTELSGTKHSVNRCSEILAKKNLKT